MSLFGMLFACLRPSPKIRRTAVSGVIVSTVDSIDAGPETAILNGNGAMPVERYGSVQEAIAGHSRWVETCRQQVPATVNRLGYGDLVDDEQQAVKAFEGDSAEWKELLALDPSVEILAEES
jgi:hypothetical protein